MTVVIKVMASIKFDGIKHRCKLVNKLVKVFTDIFK